jgi:predicted NAD/FAD-binding protein
MTFGVSRNEGQFEWAGTSLSGVFAQRRNIFSPSMWRMIFDIIRFNQYALDVLSEEVEISNIQSISAAHREPNSKSNREETIGEYLCRNRYSDKFRDDYLIPMTACVWSTSPDKCSLEFPAATLIRFLWNHHLLNTITARPPWLTIPGGSNQYVETVMKDVPRDRVHLNTPVELVKSDFGSVTLLTATGLNETFDHVILATHGDQALDLIHKGATEEEVLILNRFHTSENIAVLHSDLSV